MPVSAIASAQPVRAAPSVSSARGSSRSAACASTPARKPCGREVGRDAEPHDPALAADLGDGRGELGPGDPPDVRAVLGDTLDELLDDVALRAALVAARDRDVARLLAHGDVGEGVRDAGEDLVARRRRRSRHHARKERAGSGGRSRDRVHAPRPGSRRTRQALQRMQASVWRPTGWRSTFVRPLSRSTR